MEWRLRGLTQRIGGGFKASSGISPSGGEEDTIGWHGDRLGIERQGI